MLTQRLGEGDRDRIRQHYSKLDEDDLHLRFGYLPHSPALDEYVRKIDFQNDAVYGVFDEKLNLAAVSHLCTSHQDPQTAEFGVSVHKTFRCKGLGMALLERSIEHAANTGVRCMVIQTLVENKPMLKLMLRHVTTVDMDGRERIAHVPVEPGTFLSRLHEVTLDEWALLHHHADQGVLAARQVWRSIRGFRTQGLWHPPGGHL